MKTEAPGTMTIHGKEFVIIPREEYLALIHGKTVDALDYSMASLGRKLRKIRENAGLTQVQLAKKLKCSQSMVASSEAGRIKIGQRYLSKVLAACGAGSKRAS